jgi:ubiquinone/menaquinone biosynthesis C-methylase UbiE
MTPQMITKARANAQRDGYDNVEFRLGEIEHLPVADASIDVIISNCVINLSPDKADVFADAFRVLRPGGRLAISDVVAFAAIPDQVREDIALHSSCVSGAEPVGVIEELLLQAGFEQVRVIPKDESKAFMAEWAPGTPITDYVVSATIEGRKPAA